LRAKFTKKDSNFFVRDVGRGNGVLESSLQKLQKCCEGEEWDDEDRKPVCTYFGKRFGKIYLVCLLMNFSWRQITTNPQVLMVVGEQW